jgi:Rrf2 family nitric oxide-sensitive transcriptional repressor
MRLTAYTDYALRALIYLALEPGRLATIREIAAAYAVSENHLMKIVHQLGRDGYIETVRGKGGGMRLARPPETINLGEVVRRMEAELDIVPCFASTQACAIGPSCVLKGALAEGLAAFLAALDRYSLADLAAPQRRLGALLGIDVAEAAALPSASP